MVSEETLGIGLLVGLASLRGDDSTNGNDSDRPFQTLERTGSSDRPAIEVCVYHSTDLAEANGDIPAEDMATCIAGAFEQGGLDYRVHFGFEPQPAPNERTGCCNPDMGECQTPGDSADAFWWWRDQVNTPMIPKVAADSNMLLVRSRGGGCGAVGGNVCVVGASEITDLRPYEELRDPQDRHHRNRHAGLHELGHNLGFPHDPNGGIGFNEYSREVWHRTPTVGCNDCTNACGEYIEPREFEDSINHNAFHACAISNFAIESK